MNLFNVDPFKSSTISPTYSFKCNNIGERIIIALDLFTTPPNVRVPNYYYYYYYYYYY